MSAPRLSSLVVENFRSISGEWEIPLDAEIILVHGPNGAGKTSLLSALELGATGDVQFLRGDGGLDQTLMLNRNYPIGAVQLRIEDGTEGFRSGGYEFDVSSLRGSPALDAEERTFFSERSLLAQTQLGRFLETYTATSKATDSAMVQFVKSLVGLEDLDSLIEGLRSAGHVSRTRNSSDGWISAERRSKALDDEAASEANERRLLEGRIREADSSLREVLGHLDDDTTTELLLDEALSISDSEAELVKLQAARVQLDGLTRSRTDAEDAHDSARDEADRAESAARAYGEWESTATTVLAVINDARGNLFDQAPVSGARLFEAFDDLRAQVREARANQRNADSKREEQLERRSRLEQEIATVTAHIEDVAARIGEIQLPPDAKILIEALASVVPAIHGDSCPVCEQPYPGGAGALREHVEKTLGRLSSAAAEHLQGESEQRSLKRRLSDLEVSRDGISVPDASSGTDLAQTLRALNGLEAAVDSGRSLLQRVQSTQARLVDLAARRAANDAAAQALASIRQDLELPAEGRSIAEEMQYLDVAIDRKVTEAQFVVKRRLRARELAQRIIEQDERLREAKRRIADLDHERTFLDRRLKEANARKNAANELKKSAERTRSDVITRVFDETLNGLWGDIFKRFAPTEPFTPRFKKQVGASRFVDVQLETFLEDGQVAGAPGDMLSFGNSNTAAVSLFIALHLSAPSRVPWLVFDDPVQSMDDIHVANFATVVRQLAYAHARQIVIAVHQRELFDYLSLELAPASAGQSLLKVHLDRVGGATRINWDRVHHRAEAELAIAT